MDQTFNTRLQFHEGAVVGDIGHPARELGFHRILGGNSFPGIRFQLFHPERDTLRLCVEAYDLNLDGLPDLQGLRRVVDTPPGDVRDVQKAVDAT